MVDLSFLKKFTKGDSTKMKRYISMYLKAAPEIFESMQRDLDSKNWTNLAISAHSLKPQVEFMGIISLKDILIRIENKIKDKQYKHIEELVKKALVIYQESEVDLNKVIITLD